MCSYYIYNVNQLYNMGSSHDILFSSSVQLLGDLLYRISGVSGKMSTETANEDDNFGTEQSHKVCFFLEVGKKQCQLTTILLVNFIK
jgi:hypothetical protein